jgi:phosphoserine phosphatase RsbU/P
MATVLVVARSAAAAGELVRSLAEAGFTVQHAEPSELTARPGLLDGPDVVLLSAALGLRRVALLSRRISATVRNPAVLVFPEGDLADLEMCARGGFDYVAPPYLPGLLRNRLGTGAERGQLVGLVEAVSVEASLRAYERDLHIAREIQAGFLPDRLPAAPGWEFPFRFRPAREMSGDFYDGFELIDGRRLAFIVADVCDKGVSAALFMALIRTLLRHTAEEAGSWTPMPMPMPRAPGPPGEPVSTLPPALALGAGPLVRSVTSTNRYLARHHLRQGYFVTLFFGVLDPASGALLFINGGHNPPVLLRPDGGQTLLQPTGPAVGMMTDSVYSIGQADFRPGDSLFLYTDGVVDARSAQGEQFGTQRLFDILARPVGGGAELLDAVDDALAEHVGGATPFDDITMLVLRRMPP